VPLAVDSKKKEDIDWFYGQVKKYHDSERLPEPSFSTQHSSIIPVLREYQKKAVNWMLYREGIIPAAADTKVNLADCFMRKMYIPITLSRVDTEVTDAAFYNPFLGYVCRKRPSLSNITTGGILADEMGLGKTVEVLSLILLNQRKDLIGEVKEEFIEESDSGNHSEEVLKNSRTRGRGKRMASSNKIPVDKKKRKTPIPVKPLVHPNLKRKRCLSPCEFEVSNVEGTEMASVKNGPSTRETEANIEVGEPVINEKIASPSKESKPVRANKSGGKKGRKAGISKGKNKKNPVGKREKPSSFEDMPHKKETTYDRVKWMYESALGAYDESKNATVQPKFHGEFFNPNIGIRGFFECVCGEELVDNDRQVSPGPSPNILFSKVQNLILALITVLIFA
jgi:hypothetical protein